MSDKINKLSDAIRIGAKAGHQMRHILMDSSLNSCAIGAAFIAIGTNPSDIPDWAKLNEKFKIQGMIRHPIKKLLMTINRVVVSLNNDYEWSRERIADWLESEGR